MAGSARSAADAGTLRPWESARVLVVGDVMLDRYWFGEVSRISPEAPVPVVHVERSDERPGGAANVARGVAALGAESSLLAVVGADEPAATLERLLREDGVRAILHRDPELHTTVKLRVIGRQQQLLRIDFETAPSHDVLLTKLSDFGDLVDHADVVILSDYGKGGLHLVDQMIARCRERGRPVLVDPKGDDFERYRGATLVTPNRSEFRAVAGSWRNEREFAEKAESVRARFEFDALLVTRSEEGMTLFRPGEIVHESARAREVFDVSGAGDTVIATLGVMLARGADLARAMREANRAAGIVVGKLGTAVVHRHELELEEG